MVDVKTARRDLMASPNAFVLTISLPWTGDVRHFQPTPLSTEWKDQVVEAGNTIGKLVEIYVTADSKEKMVRWKEFLACHIARN